MVEVAPSLGIGSMYVKTGIEPTQPPLPPPPKLLGPFETLVKFSGLDCSRTRKESIRSPRGIIATIVAIFTILNLFVHVASIMQIEEHPFTIGWSETNVYGFMAIQSLISAGCIISWTRDNFISQFEDTLQRIRTMRLSTGQTIDDYSKFHRKAAIMIIPIFFVTLSTSFYSSMTHRYTIKDNSTFYSDSPIFMVAPILDFIGSIATSLAIVIYVSVNVALNREIQHFNKELTNSARFQQLTLPQVLNTYSKRHSDIIQLIRFSNQHSSKFSSMAPVFTLLAFINAMYIIGSFRLKMELFVYIMMIGWAIISLGLSLCSFLPAVRIQDNIQDTSEILMHDDVLQTCGDDQMHHTYRVTLDRCLHSKTKIAFLNYIPIDSQSFNQVMFYVPNMSALMIFYKEMYLR